MTRLPWHLDFASVGGASGDRSMFTMIELARSALDETSDPDATHGPSSAGL
jgi:hypothetical protein